MRPDLELAPSGVCNHEAQVASLEETRDNPQPDMRDQLACCSTSKPAWGHPSQEWARGKRISIRTWGQSAAEALSGLGMIDRWRDLSPPQP